MTDRFAHSLGTGELSWQEVADALWLAGWIGTAEETTPGPVPGPSPPGGDFGPGEEPEPPEPGPAADGDGYGGTGDTPEPESAFLADAGGGRAAGRDTTARTTPDWPSPSGLPGARDIARALRPLMRTVRSVHTKMLDEEGTAVRAAEEGLWLPAYKGAEVHPFDVVLVIDNSASMRIWRRTAAEFRTLLERQGAFRDVRSVRLDTGRPGKLVLYGERDNSHGLDPAQLVDPTGRRIILVLTDGVGEAWRTGAMGRLLANWGRSSPVAVVDVLPADLWHWAGIRVVTAELHALLPGVPNHRLAWQPVAYQPTVYAPGSTAVPVLGLDARWFTRWAELVTATAPGGVRLPVLALPLEEESGPAEPPDDLSAAERVLRFRTTATPAAFHLAGLLAAAPLTIKMMRAVQGSLAPESAPAHLAEVLLGGLMVDVAPARVNGAPVVEYEFAPKLRSELLATSTRDDTARVFRLVGDLLGPEVESMRNLRQVMRDPDKAAQPVISTQSKPFLQVERDVLTALAGPYARRAIRLGEALAAHKETSNNPGTRTSEILDAAGHDDAIWSPPIDSAEPIQSGRGKPALTTTRSEQASESRSTGDQPAVWGGVPLRNVNFIGRAGLLNTLRDRLSHASPAAVLPEALHGLGGIGKSQIAVEYVYRHAADYDLIWWIPSENPSEIQTALAQLAVRLGLSSEPSVDTAVPAVKEALRVGEPYGRWLLVFDNADRPEDVRPFFPAGNGHILVTSRNSQWTGVARAVEVDVFERLESRELLQRRNADLGDVDADRLAEVLGDLPLAVEQAAAWRAETGMATEEYLRLFEDKRTELLESRPPADYEVAVEAAWNVSLDRLSQNNPGALELLQVCAFFAPEPISRSLFTGVRNIPVSPELERLLGDPIQLGRAIREIGRYSLARIDHRTNTIQLHRLVQTVLRNKLDPDEQERVRHSGHLLLANGDPDQPDLVEHWQRYGELLPHVRAVRAMDCTDDWARRLAINIAVYQFAAGDPAGALETAKELRTFWLKKLGEKHTDTLVASRWYGRALRAVGRFDEARRIGQETLDLMRETLGPEHEETLRTAHAVASDLRAQGNFVAARDLNKIAYESACDSFGIDDPDTLAAANNYALSLRLVGDFTAARQLDEQTWQRKKDVLGENHRHTLLTLDNLSVDLRESGEYVLARRRQEETVRRFRDVVGDRHPMTLSAIKNLAVARRKAGDHRGGQQLAREAVEGLRGRYGRSHPDAMSAAMNLSLDLRQAGDKQAARKLGKEVNELYEASWGKEHPFSLAGATNLAVTLRLLGEWDTARELNETALAHMRVVLGEDHPFTLVCATNLASDLAVTGQFAAAHELDVNTLERSRRALGDKHPSTLAVTVNLALDLRGLARADEADAVHAEAVTLLREVLGHDHPATNDAMLNVRANCDIDPMQI